MPTPSLFPIFLKAQAGGGSVAAGTAYIETFGLEMLEMIDVEVIDTSIDVEVIDLAQDVEVLEVIDVEILC